MAAQYASGQVTATQVGAYFVQQYYQVFQQQRDSVHQFYNDASSMVRVEDDGSKSVSGSMEIHNLITSLNFTGIEIKTINSLESWNGGVLVVVTGSIKSRDFSGSRKFVQTFFLAPQENGYFVLNDVFHMDNEEVYHQPPQPAVTESSHIPEPPAVSDYALEEEAREYVNSVHIEGNDPVEEYSYQDHQQEIDYQIERREEETTFEEPASLPGNAVPLVGEPLPAVEPLPAAEPLPAVEPLPSVEEPVGEPPKRTYASILRAPKTKSSPPVNTQPSFAQNTPASDWHATQPSFSSDWGASEPSDPSDWNVSQPSVQPVNSATPTVPDSGVDAPEDDFSQEEGVSKSVYVRNLPSTITSADIFQEFKNFGKIKYDGVFVRNRKDTAVCYAFVEFEDVQSVQEAIKASPIQLAGRQVYIEERRPNNGSTSRGGRRGRGRGGRFGGRTFGRGSDQDGYESNRVRSNGFRT